MTTPREAIDRAIAMTRAVKPDAIDHALALVGSRSPSQSRTPSQSRKRGPSTIIRVTADQRDVVDQAETALVVRGGVYVRGRKLVQIVRDKGSGWLRRPDGQAVIVPIRKERLRELLGSAARWESVEREGQTRRVQPPAWVAVTLMEREEWKFPPLEGVIDSPAFRPDGSILDQPGYDPITRLYYDPACTYPAIPERPTHDDAKRALGELLEPFVDFPFLADSDRAAVAAFVLTVVGRAAIDGPTPMFTACAPTPGSGKGLLVDCASIIATGSEPAKMAATSDDDETRKRMLALAIESPSIVCLDNVVGDLDSAVLAMALTAEQISDRVLGSTTSARASIRFVVTVTGNNVTLRGDLGRRAVPIDLDPEVEHPEDRQDFAHPNLKAYVREHRARFVVAALTVLRSFHVAGRPTHGQPAKGSFESWDAIVRGSVMWAGAVDPLAGVSRIREQGDADLDNLRTLLNAWHAAYGTAEMTTAKVLDDVGGIAVGSKYKPLAQALAAYRRGDRELDGRAFASVLRKVKGRISDDLRLVRVAENAQGGAALWRVIPCGARATVPN